MKRVTKINQHLTCKLTTDELLTKGQQIATAARDRSKLEDEKASNAKLFKEKIDGLTGDIREIANVLNSGEETRLVECERIFDYSANTVTTIRLDTFERVSERAMSSDERQLEMEIVKSQREKAKLVAIDGGAGAKKDEPTVEPAPEPAK